MNIIARVWKSLTAQPTVKWVNTYEFENGGWDYFSSDQLWCQELANDLVSYEETFHLDTTRFDRVVLSTYLPDSHPYDPNALVVFDRDDTGDIITFGGVPEALTTVLKVKRSCVNGRAGKLHYRNCLLDSWVESNSVGKFLTPTASVIVNAAFLVAKAFLGDELASMVLMGESLDYIEYPAVAAGVKQKPIRHYVPITNVRRVVGLTIQGLGEQQLNNKYFDK